MSKHSHSCALRNAALLLLLVITASLAPAQSISIGSVLARPGTTVQVPVNITATGLAAGVNLCVEFNPDVLLAPAVTRGPLLSASHLIAANTPAFGRLHVVAQGPLNAGGFTAAAGTVLYLNFQVASNAPIGSCHFIRFASYPMQNVAVSGLSDLLGRPMPHLAIPGMVAITGADPVSVTNTSQANYALDVLLPGKALYGDRPCMFLDPIPPRCLGQAYIRTLQAHADQVASDFLRFQVDRPVTVYVLIDERTANPPAWVRGWGTRQWSFTTTDAAPGRKVYARAFPAGQITLGSNRDVAGPTGRSMYSVVIAPEEKTAAGAWMLYR